MSIDSGGRREPIDLVIAFAAPDATTAALVRTTIRRVHGAAVRPARTRVALVPDEGTDSISSLEAAAWMLLLVSPDAADSPGLDAVARRWLELGRGENLLIGVTSYGESPSIGAIDWMSGSGVLPRVLRGHFAEEPLALDFAQRDPDGQPSTRLRSEAIRTVAAIRGVEPEVVDSADRRTTRRWRRVARTATFVLVALLAASIVSGQLALQSRRRADVERREAVRAALIATAEQQAEINPEASTVSAILADAIRSDPDSLHALSSVIDQPIERRIGLATTSLDVVAISPFDGRAAIVDGNQTMYILDPATLEVTLQVDNVSDQAVRLMRWSSNPSEVLISDLDGSVSRVDLLRGQSTLLLAGDKLAWGGDFTPSGKFVRLFQDGTVEVWETAQVVRRVVSKKLDPKPSVAAWSTDDGASLAIGRADGVLELLVPSTLESVRTSNSVGEDVVFRDLAWSRDGHIAAVWGQEAAIADSQTMNGPKFLTPQQPETVAWSADSKWVSITTTTGIVTYDVEAQASETQVNLPGGAFKSAAWTSGNDRVLVVVDDGTLWSLRSSSPLSRPHSLASGGTALSIDVSAGQDLIAIASTDVRLWSIGDPPQTRSPTLAPPPEDPDNYYLQVLLNPIRPEIVVGERSGVVARYAVGSTTPSDTLDLEYTVYRMVSDTNFRWIAVALATGEVAVVDTSTWKEIARLDVSSGLMRGLAVSPDDSMIVASSADGAIKIWRTSDWSLLRSIPQVAPTVQNLVWSGDQTKLYAAAEDATVHVYDVETGRLLRRLVGPSASVRAIAMSPDFTMLAAADEDGRLWLWDAESEKLLAGPLVRHTGEVFAMKWLDEDHLVVADERGIVWTLNPATWRDVACQQIEHSDVSALWHELSASLDLDGACDSAR